MSMRSWFRTHRKQIITHTSIIVGFVLFTIFVAEPLFDRLERVEGEAQLQRLELPAETNAIYCSIDLIDIAPQTIEMEGWAFIGGQSIEDSKVYMVMKSKKTTYVFDTFAGPRQPPGDIQERFKELNLGQSGFRVIIPIRKIDRGEYILGLYIIKGDIQALQYTDNAVVKSGDIAKLTVRMSEVQEIPLPPESGEIRLGVDLCEGSEEDEKEFMQIQGWAFIDGQSAEDSTIYMVLKSGRATYIFDTHLQKRPDVTAAYVESGLNLDNSGFIAGIPVDTVGVGTYELGIYIKKGDIEALQYMGSIVEF